MTVKKYIGSDCELSTSGIDGEGRAIGPWEVTRRILGRIDAAFAPRGLATWSSRRASSAASGPTYAWRSDFDPYESAHSSDCLRHWAPNGQCYYSDMSHVEVCTASSLYPRRYAAGCFAALRVAEEARRRAESEADGGARYSLSTSNTDLRDPSVSWGSHVNAAVSGSLWEDLCGEGRHPAVLGFVASAFAAAIPFFGAGYLLPLKDGTVVYSLSARAHHLSRVVSHSTTEAFRRGLINARHEPHGEGQERLHLIGFDHALASAALKGSFLQCVLAAAEEGFCEPILFDPVHALRTWSWGLDLETGRLDAPALLVGGRRLTLHAYVRELSSRLLEMCEGGLITEEVAPEGKEMLSRVIELTHHAERGDLLRSAGQLDWAAKLLCILDLTKEAGRTLGDPETRLADHDFSSSDPESGLLWRLWDRGLVDPLVSEADIEACVAEGPAESRDWGRGQILRRFIDEVTDVDWSFIELRCESSRWGRRLRIDLPRLDGLSKAAFQETLEDASTVDDLEAAIEKEKEKVAETQESDPVLDVRSQLAGPVPEEGSRERS